MRRGLRPEDRELAETRTQRERGRGMRVFGGLVAQ